MYVVRGEFLNFHIKPQYDSKSIPTYKLMELTSPISTFSAMKEDIIKKTGAIMLYESPSYWGHEVMNGTVLFLKVPMEERERIDALLYDKYYSEQFNSETHSAASCLRDLYIHWEEGKNEFKSFWARMTSIKEEFSKPLYITLDELIGSGNVLSQEDRGKPLEHLMSGYLIIRLRLIRRKRLFKEYWDWSIGTEFIQKE